MNREPNLWDHSLEENRDRSLNLESERVREETRARERDQWNWNQIPPESGQGRGPGDWRGGYGEAWRENWRPAEPSQGAGAAAREFEFESQGGYGRGQGYGREAYDPAYGGFAGDDRFVREGRPRQAREMYREQLPNTGPASGYGPRGHHPDDRRIYEDVCELLTRHGWLDASDIEVRVERGEVTLTGRVDSRAGKRLAEDTAERARGVRDVHNRLRVTSPASGEPYEPGTSMDAR